MLFYNYGDDNWTAGSLNIKRRPNNQEHITVVERALDSFVGDNGIGAIGLMKDSRRESPLGRYK